MKNRLLRFSAASQEETRPGGELTPQQLFVAEAFAIFDECGAERPSPSLLCRWRRRHFNGDSAAMLFALNVMGDKGQLSRPVEYVGTVLANGAASGSLLQQPRQSPRRTLAVGDRNLDGTMVYDGVDWNPVQKPPGGSGA